MSLHPHIKPRFNGTQCVMLDVIIALVPVLFVACLAYGWLLLLQVGIALLSAVFTEWIFGRLLLRNWKSIFDGSAVVTALLLVCTLAPLTPWYVVAFGSFSAILFGKIIWGGLGKNRFNPALLGREFMSVFFASAMTSPDIWKANEWIVFKSSSFFSELVTDYGNNYLSGLLYKTSGAMGECSIAAILLGGLYLLFRNRISWHVPFALLTIFTVLLWVNGSDNLPFSIAGVLFGTLFMATDMPSSPTTAYGKYYYGTMIGVCVFLFIKGGVRFEYMSYAILLLNGFSENISQVFTPTVWGETLDWKKKTEAVLLLTLKILTVAAAVFSLHWHELTAYVVYIYIVYITLKFSFSFSKSLDNYV